MRTHAAQRQLGNSEIFQKASSGTTAPPLTIGDLLPMFLRHKWFVGACLVLCATTAAIYLAVATPIYEASASLRIDPARASSLGLSDLLSAAGGMTTDTTLTEISILKSDIIAIDVLDSLSNDDFKGYAGTTKEALGFTRGASSFSEAQEKLLIRFKKRLSVKQVEGTQLVAISFRDPSPRISATMANHVVSAYLKQSFDSRYGSVSQVSDWLSSEMGSLRDKASEAQRKLANFQEKNEILGSDSSNNTTIDRLNLLNTRLAEAQSERIVKEAQMRAAASATPAVLASLYPDANLSALQAEQGTLYAQYAQQSTKFGQSYPPLIDLKKQMLKIDSEMARVVESSRNRMKEDYDSSLRAEQMLQHEYLEQTQKAYSLNRQQAEYAVLKAEGSSSRDLYDTLQYKLKQAGVVAGLNGVNTMLVDSARAPLHPVEPRKPVILGFSLAAGLFIGVGVSLFKEAISDRVQSGEQIERVLGYPVLAAIPHLSSRQSRIANALPARTNQYTVAMKTFREPNSRGAEAYRTLRNSFLLSSIDRKLKTILVTSTLAGEGKSNTTVNYGVVLAQQGARVLIVDADLRKPTLHMKFGVENAPGLADILLGEDLSHPFLKPIEELDDLYLLTAGRQIALPSEALSSSRFYSLLKNWEDQFDYVLIDSTPLLIVSDSLPLASLADAVILVTLYNSTPMKAVTRARDVFSRIDANVAGVIINDYPGTAPSYGGDGHGYYA